MFKFLPYLLLCRLLAIILCLHRPDKAKLQLHFEDFIPQVLSSFPSISPYRDPMHPFLLHKKRGFNREVEAALGLLRPCEFLT